MARRKSVSNSKSLQIELNSLLRIDDLDNFRDVRAVSATAINPRHLQAVRTLDEREELEPSFGPFCMTRMTPRTDLQNWLTS